MVKPGCYNGINQNFIKTIENISNQVEFFLKLFLLLRLNLCYHAVDDQTFLNDNI